MVNNVAALLKMDVKELISADIITAIINPLNPEILHSNVKYL